MDEFLEQLVLRLDDWCELVLGNDFRSGAELAIVQALGSTWGDQDVAFTTKILADFLLTEILVAASALVHIGLEALPSQLRIIATPVAEAAIASQARSRGVTNFVMFIQRQLKNGYGILSAFPVSQQASAAAEFVSTTLCDLFCQIEDDELSDEGFRIANTAPLSTFLMTYLDLLRGITDFGIF